MTSTTTPATLEWTDDPNNWTVDSSLRPARGGLGTHTRDCAALPAGAVSADPWEANRRGQDYRILWTRCHNITGHDTHVWGVGLQFPDGSIDTGELEAPNVAVASKCDARGLTPSQARELAQTLLEVADTVERWTR